MSVKMSKPQAILFALTAWLTSFTVMWQMSIVVITNDLYVAFPDDGNIVTVILSWPALLTAAVGLFAGWLLKKTTTKVELILAGICMLFGIAAPMGSNITWLLVCCFLMATGAGFANTAGMAIISEVFADENVRAKQMGYYNAVMSLLGMGISLLAGVFASNGWQAALRVNWFAIPVLLMTIVFLPNIKHGNEIPEGNSQAGQPEEAADTSKGLGFRFWIFFASMFIWFLAYCSFFSFISVHIQENALGGTAFIGTCSSLTTAGSFVCALVFGFLFSKTRRKISILCSILPIICYIWSYLAPSQISVVVFSVVYGFVYGGIFTLIYAYAAACVPPSKNGIAMGLMTFNYSVAITVGVNIFAALMDSMGKITATYPVAIGFLAVSLVIELICCVKDDKDRFMMDA